MGVKKNRLRDEGGFSLVEILTVFGIVVILSALMLPNFGPTEKRFRIQRSASKLAQDIRGVQEMAMSSKKINGEIPARYGLEFNINSPFSYIIFLDMNDDGEWDDWGDPVVGSPLEFEKGVKIEKLMVQTPPSGPRNADTGYVWITFKPPNPATDIKKHVAESDQIAEIWLTDGSQTEKVIVNNAGLIYVE